MHVQRQYSIATLRQLVQLEVQTLCLQIMPVPDNPSQ